MESVSRLRRWWFGRQGCLRLLVYILVGIALFYIVEDSRGYLELESVKKELQAKGFEYDLKKIQKGGIPDEENFAASDLIRDAYRDPRLGETGLFSDRALPDVASVSTGRKNPEHGFHGPNFEPRDLFQEDLSRLEAISRLEHKLKDVEDAMAEYAEATSRPKCDWTVVMDPTDFGSEVLHLSIQSDATGDLRLEALIALEKLEPERAKLAVLTALRATRHQMTNQNLLGNLMGSLTMIPATEGLALGLQKQIWDASTLGELIDILNELREMHEWSEIVKLEIAGIVRFSSDLSEVRSYFLDMQPYFDGPIFTLPGILGTVEAKPIEDFLNRMAIWGIPRGWYWQNSAWNLHTLVHQNGVPQRAFLVPAFQGGHYSGIATTREIIFKRKILISLAIAACKLEIFHHENGEYPLPGDFAMESKHFGYMLGENGRPVLWYSENGAAPRSLKAEEYESIPKEFLWRYP